MRRFAGSATNLQHPELPTPEMNTTPLIDVMLVLLVMVMLSIPLMTNSTRVNLPQGVTGPSEPLPVTAVDVDYLSAVNINGTPLALDPDNQVQRARAIDAALARIAPGETELRIAGDDLAPYQRMVEVMAAIQRGGFERVGFVGNERFVEG